MEQDSINRLKYPGIGTLNDFENALNKKIKEMDVLRKGWRTEAVTITIPIIVHVVHVGEAVGTGLNLSQAQVQAQIDVLNEDYRKKVGTPGFNSNPVGADIGIEFCLSPVDQNGNPMTEPGIDRIKGVNATWSQPQIEATLKPQTIWNPNLFFNVWTVKFGGGSANLLGYAQFPDQSGLQGLNDDQNATSATTDGVVIQYSSFGSADKGNFPVMQAPYNKGRTLSHETGHWLGLRHIWGDGLCGNDYVDDTPQAHTENRGCPVTKLSCDGVNFEMPQNYMDYSDDACMNIFTLGQKERIVAVLELSPRRKAVVAADLCNTNVSAPPVANFTSNKQNVLRGGEVVFTDLSSNFPSTWLWTFEGGDPSTSNLQNPHVKYVNPGTFKVTLVATNSKGSSDPVVIESYITVSEEGLCGTVTNFKATYTPSLLTLKDFAVDSAGYLTGHNGVGTKAVSEVFGNSLGYSYISGVNIKFAKVYSTSEDATVTVTVWNARGIQGGPGSVIEQKTVLLKQIQEDVANNQATSITFDRETPVFSSPYHVGIELTYEGDTLAIESSANGEATNATSWFKNVHDVWRQFTIARGANIAMNIAPIVGMNPSVQVSSSKLFINPGETVTLDAHGASIFLWNSTDNSIQNLSGPQITVRPVQTTTYVTTGSGIELCNSSAVTTIFVREGEITGMYETNTEDVTVYPNPGTNSLNIRFQNAYRGDVQVQVRSILNQAVRAVSIGKSQDLFDTTIDTSAIATGVYIIAVKTGDSYSYSKWIKN
ncbi:MAG: M43 family zinc metalloprotease [Bacteroidota bacterium]